MYYYKLFFKLLRLNLLANPGLDLRIIDYALDRKRIDVPESVFDDQHNAKDCMHTVLKKITTNERVRRYCK
jgi:hypothetical protein